MWVRHIVLLLTYSVACMALSTLSACDWRRVAINGPINQEDVAFIVRGATTLDDVVTKLGAPDEVSGSEERAVFRYHFLSTKTFQINFSWILRFWTPFAPPMTLSRGESGTNVFQVTFDPHWVVTGTAFSHHADTTRFNPWIF